jgi:Ethanolamine utilization protein EutJ (predicted chaperonin)
VAEFGKGESALLVPQQAMQIDQTGPYVLVVDKDNKIQVRRIETGADRGASIVIRNTQGWDVKSITLVGGSSSYLGMADVVQAYTGIPTTVPAHPLFVTPLGIALHHRPNGTDRREDHE